MAASPTARIFRAVVLALAATVVVFVGVGYVLTDRWDVDSERRITAPVERVEPLLRDFAAWQDWSGMAVELGAGMKREISGTPGEAGHRVAWTGAQGEAILRMSDVAPGRIDYEFLTRRSEEPDTSLVARGHIAWQADGDETVVTWHDEGRLRNLIERWIGWFGALQEQVRQIQGVSLAGLQKAVDDDAGQQKK